MSTQSFILRAFTGGELSPALAARADMAQYLAGLRQCRNMIVQSHGGVAKRPGTIFAGRVKNDGAYTRLVPFSFKSADRSYALEFGNEYIRFWWHGALVEDPMSPGDPLEVTTPYQTSELSDLKFAQSVDVLTITHRNYVQKELKRIAHDNWTLTDFSIAPTLSAPASAMGSAGTAGSLVFAYVITAARKDTYEESVGSSVVTLNCDEPTPAAPNTLSWDANADAAEYYVYMDRFQNGVYGYIGTALSNSFRDPGFVADPTITPPVLKDLFNASGKYPGVCAYNQQRLLFANSTNDRETVWGSRVGAYHNFSISTPLQDDDAIEFIIAGAQFSPVSWLIPLKKLIVMSDAGVFLAQGDDTGVLRPTAINIDQQGYVGASTMVPPAVVGNGILYVDSNNKVIRDLSFDQVKGGFAGMDLTIFAEHLFDGHYVIDMAFQRVPNSILWVIRDDGVLLGLTYNKEQDIVAWHRHDTDGIVESICVLPSQYGDDEVYLVVQRELTGIWTRRFVERLGTRYVPAQTEIEDAFFVDAGLTYDGAPATAISGLGHIEGKRLAVVADGVVVSNGRTGRTYTAIGGAITPELPTAASKVQAGLPMPYSDIETLDLDVAGSSIRDKQKRVQSLSVLLQHSRHGFLAGPDEDHLRTDRPQPWETDETLLDGQSEVSLQGSFTKEGRVFIRHDQPMPFTVLALIPNAEVV